MGSSNSRTGSPSAEDQSRPDTIAEPATSTATDTSSLSSAPRRLPKRRRGGSNRQVGEGIAANIYNSTASMTMSNDNQDTQQHEAEALEQNLAEVELGLTQRRGILFSPTDVRGSQSGTAIFESIGSALGSIRSRLQDLTGVGGGANGASGGDNAASGLGTLTTQGRSNSTLLTGISERLAAAERAHSTRMPLGLLQSELSRRGSAMEHPNGAAAVSDADSLTNVGTDSPVTPSPTRPSSTLFRQTSRSSSSTANPSLSSSEDDDTGTSPEAKRRRSSSLVASRRRSDVHERHDVELHEGTAVTAAQSRRSVLPPTILEHEEDTPSSSISSLSPPQPQTQSQQVEEDGDSGTRDEIELLLPESTRGQLDAAVASSGSAGGGTAQYTYHHLTGSLRVLSQSASSSISLGTTSCDATSQATDDDVSTPEPNTPEYPPIFAWGSLRFARDCGNHNDDGDSLEEYDDGADHKLHGEQDDNNSHKNRDRDIYDVFGCDFPDEDRPDAKTSSYPTTGVSKTPVALPSNTRLGRSNIVSMSIARTHMAFATATGSLLICGDNSQGAVDPSQKSILSIPRPTRMELLAMNRILMVSCGVDHTAAITETRSVLTWGNNRFGQLGHRTKCSTTGSDNQQNFVLPKAMQFGGRAAQVACGDGFTLVLTTRMAVYMCGREEITGHNPSEATTQCPTSGGTGENQTSLVRMPEQNSALQGLPLVYVAAGHKHAVVLTAHGTAYSWGSNDVGQCGREYPNWLKVPVPIAVPKTKNQKAPSTIRVSTLSPMANWDVWTPGDPISLADDVNIVHVACGKEHTVLVTKSGQLLVCGSNARGQLSSTANTPSFTNVHPVQHPLSGRKFVTAEAGSHHTVMLDDSGSVWELGSGKLEEVISPLAKSPIRSIAAGGSLTLAIAQAQDAGTGTNHDTTPPASLPRMPGLDALMEAIRIEHDQSCTDAATLPKTEELARRTEELFRSAAVMNSLFMNPKEIDGLYLKLIHGGHNHEVQQRIVTAMEKGMQQALQSLTEARLMYPEAIRFLLLFLQCPLFRDNTTLTTGADNEEDVSSRIQFDVRGQMLFSLCETILGMPFEGYKAFLAWTTAVYGKELFVPFLVKPLVLQLNNRLQKSKTHGIPLIAGVLRWLHTAAERAEDDLAKAEDFYCAGIGEITMESLFEDLARFKKATRSDRSVNFYLSANSFLMSPSVKRNLLQVENQLGMVKAAQSGGVAFDPATREFLFKPYFVLAIDRKYLLQQTLQAVAQASPGELRKSLKVVFKGEDGVDAGGVTKEFFQLLVQKLFDVNTGMWSTRFGCGNETWFNSDCTWNDDGFYLVGVLTGLALYNSVILDVHFPPAVYRKLLGQPLGLEDMVDEGVGKGLRNLLEYDGDDVEDVFCLNFELSWMDLGKERKMELKPGGADIPVTKENKEEYVLLYVKWLLVDSVENQYKEFERGFMQVMEGSSLDLLRAEELELLVVGTPELDFVALERNASYEGGFDKDSPVVKNLWRFVQSAPIESQLKFLKFCTGSGKAPIGGLGELPFKIQRAGPDSMQLPTSHTCFNTLILPDYGDDYDKLADRLGRAVIECEGFGLQ